MGILRSETLGDSQPLPCPWKGFLWLGLGGLHRSCAGLEAVGHLWHSRAGPSTGVPFPMAVIPCRMASELLGRLVSSCSLIPTDAHRGMSPEGSFKRAANSSAPREAVPRTAAYVVGKISLFLLTPAQHPLFSKMVPPASTD